MFTSLNHIQCENKTNGEFAEAKNEFDNFAAGRDRDLRGYRAVTSSTQNGVR